MATLSRRGVLAQLAAVVVVPSSLPCSASDPIFAVIEQHRRAVKAHSDAVSVEFAFERPGMKGETLIQFRHLQIATAAAADEMDDAGTELLNTPATTVAGLIALCRHVQPYFEEEEATELPHRLFWDDETDSRPAAAFANVIAVSLRKIRETWACG